MPVQREWDPDTHTSLSASSERSTGRTFQADRYFLLPPFRHRRSRARTSTARSAAARDSACRSPSAPRAAAVGRSTPRRRGRMDETVFVVRDERRVFGARARAASFAGQDGPISPKRRVTPRVVVGPLLLVAQQLQLLLLLSEDSPFRCEVKVDLVRWLQMSSSSKGVVRCQLKPARRRTRGGEGTCMFKVERVRIYSEAVEVAREALVEAVEVGRDVGERVCVRAEVGDRVGQLGEDGREVCERRGRRRSRWAACASVCA